MWTSTNFQIYKKQFDFTSSGQGKPTYTALNIDNIELINIIEGIDGEIGKDQVFQTILCSYCGFYHCERGNWIALRRLDDFILFIPAFEKLKEEQNQKEYAPPHWLKQKGAFWLENVAFEKLKKLVPEISKQKSINKIAKPELLALYKLETPNQLFGDFPDFTTLRKNDVLFVSDFDNETAFEILDHKLRALEAAADFEISLLTENDNIISIFLDDNSTTEWKALCKTKEDYELILGETFKIALK